MMAMASRSQRETRLVVGWCPNWPAQVFAHESEPVAVLEKGRVIAATASARESGVASRQRKREAEHHCPNLVVCDRDVALEARRFDPIVAAVTMLTPLVEVTRPGMFTFDVRGPARYFGGEEALLDRLRGVLTPTLMGKIHIGIADGRFAASLAARRDAIVPKGKSREFLSPFPVSMLGDEELTNLLVRLGLYTLGDFARLPADAVRTRFGPFGEQSHRQARGLDESALHAKPPGIDLVTRAEFDPTVDRIDQAAFIGRGIANDLIEMLGREGLDCTRLIIEAETKHAEKLSRCWRAEDRFSVATIVERLRWQLEGWLSGSAPEATPTAGIEWIRLVADEVVPSRARQFGLFGERSDADERAIRGLDRLRGLLGPDAVFIAFMRGGRGPSDRVQLVPWGEPIPSSRIEGPWPGRHPRPSPALIYPRPHPAVVRGEDGETLRVLADGRFSGTPATLSINGASALRIDKWSAPWLLDEQFWDVDAHRRRARCQLLLEDRRALLAFVEGGNWFVEAEYD
jgi:protein ImuB